MKKKWVALIVIIYPLWVFGQHSIYVDDVSLNGDGSFSNPYNDIKTAMLDVGPGDTIFVKPGTYTNFSGYIATKTNGEKTRRITIKALDPSNKPIFTHFGGIFLIQHGYYTIDGLIMDVQFDNETAVTIRNDGNGTELLNCEIRNGTSGGVHIQGVRDILVEGCEIYNFLKGTFDNNSDAHGIAGMHSRNITIRNCDIHHVSGDCFQTDPYMSEPLWDSVFIENSKLWTGPLPADAGGYKKGESPGENAIDTKTDPTKVGTDYRPLIVIKNVEVYGFDDSGPIDRRAAFNIKHNVNCIIENAVVHDNHIGFRLRGPYTYNGTYGGAWVKMINTIAFNNDKGMRLEEDLEVLEVYNSTFDKDGSSVYIENTGNGTGVDPAGLKMLNNVFIGSKPNEASDASNFVAQEIDFLNAANHNYHLSLNSDCIDEGIDLTEVPYDFDGYPRQSGSYDVGAYEYRLITDTQDISKNQIPISIYPNFIGEGEFHIVSDDQSLEIMEMKIIDITGATRYSQKFSGSLSHVELKLSELQTGMYIVHVETNKGEVNKKIFKQ